MRPYGLKIIPAPDCADIRAMGSPGHIGHLPGHNGDIRSNFRNPEAKARTRRHWKRYARAEGKNACRDEAFYGVRFASHQGAKS